MAADARFAACAMGLRKRIDSRKTATPRAEGGGKSRQQWQQWGNMLRKYQLQGLAIWLLEAAGPLALVSAQLLYIGTPLLGSGAGDLARLLESDDDTLDFANFLQGSAVADERLTQGPRA